MRTDVYPCVHVHATNLNKKLRGKIMNYTDAFKAHGIVEEIEQNNKDMRTFRNAINNGIVDAQITIKCKDGTFMSTVYKDDRIDLLLKVLSDRNNELMTKLREL